jgi:hypothetical protein
MCLPTFSYFLIVNKTLSLSHSLSLSLSLSAPPPPRPPAPSLSTSLTLSRALSLSSTQSPNLSRSLTDTIKNRCNAIAAAEVLLLAAAEVLLLAAAEVLLLLLCDTHLCSVTLTSFSSSSPPLPADRAPPHRENKPIQTAESALLIFPDIPPPFLKSGKPAWGG